MKRKKGGDVTVLRELFTSGMKLAMWRLGEAHCKYNVTYYMSWSLKMQE